MLFLSQVLVAFAFPHSTAQPLNLTGRAAFALPERRCIVTATDTDLTTETDIVLDATLARVFADHRAAADAGDVAEQRVCHEMAMSILGEQAKRRDAVLGISG